MPTTSRRYAAVCRHECGYARLTAVTTVVLPVFGTVALGYGLTRSGLFNQAVGAALVRFMFYLAIPAMLVRDLAAADLPATVPWAFLAAFYLPSVLVFAAGMGLSRLLCGWSPREAGMAGMTAGYSNLFLLGLPLCLSAFGAAGAVPLYILLATQSIVLFPMTTFALESGRAGQAGFAGLASLFRHPVLLALACGIGLNLGGVQVPALLDRLLAILGATAPGCALVALGVTLAATPGAGAWRNVWLLVGLKNLAHPVLVWSACRLLGIDATWSAVAVMLAAMPSGVNALVFARQYNVREDEVARTIVLSTIVSCVVAGLILAGSV